jgi:hypothetical protein
MNGGKVELLQFDPASAHRVLNEFDFDIVAQTLGVSVTQIKKALLTTVISNRIVRDVQPAALR